MKMELSREAAKENRSGVSAERRSLNKREVGALPRRLYIAITFATVARLHAATLTPDQTAFFESKIRPILVDNCYKCHSHDSEKLKGGLSVEYRESLLKGGETGAAIVPGDPEKSLLIKAVRYTDPDLQMPPKNKKLSETQIADLVTWVRMGAPDPRVAGAVVATKGWGEKAKDHWAFKPVKKVSAPEVKDAAWPDGAGPATFGVPPSGGAGGDRVNAELRTGINPIDAFIFAKLEANGMKPSPLADKRTLIRRATFDLLGLPPSPAEVKA
ncbi:MAG: c-type cytochrome domain-containing protein, partial [Verrucomicrobiota bacterium]